VSEHPEEVLAFWFGDARDGPQHALARMPFWFGPSAQVDREISERFGAVVDRAGAGELSSWEAEPPSALALVLALDQFPRNIYRADARAFAHDALALAVARRALARGFERSLAPIEHAFLLLPLEHAEELAAQDECVARSRALAESCPAEWAETMLAFVPYAEQHRAIIERFGRFPHRNRALGRRSTPDEAAFLAGSAEAFGQGGDRLAERHGGG
jgi:uncharacterized protein (DUF924 family)